MPVNNGTERQKELIEQRPIFRCLQVAINRMEHPERRINGVVLRRLSTVRETIGNEPSVGIGCKCFEETTSFVISLCTQEQSRQ